MAKIVMLVPHSGLLDSVEGSSLGAVNRQIDAVSVSLHASIVLDCLTTSFELCNLNECSTLANSSMSVTPFDFLTLRFHSNYSFVRRALMIHVRDLFY